MSSEIPRRSIQALGLEDSEEVSLYLELIRIIEKDIDEIKEGETRNGWTSWAILGGIAGALLLLFGETRKLQSFPLQEVKTTVLAGILLYIGVIPNLRVLYHGQMIRPGRIRWSDEAYFSLVPSGVYSLLISLVSIIIAFTLPLPTLAKLPIVTAFAISIVLTVLVLVLSKLKFPFGGNRWSRKGALGMASIMSALSIVGVVALGMRLQFPLGEVTTLPYVLAGLILALLVLIANLIYTRTPSRLLSNLQDLRNDIIFLRVDIDEALRRYEVLTEGETLPDALQKELSEVLSDLNVIAYAHSNMHRLLDKLNSEFPFADDTKEEKEAKLKEVKLDRDSYLLHEQKCNEVLSSLGSKLKDLNKKMARLSAASEDWASANTIRSSLTQRLTVMDQFHSQLRERMQTINYYLSHPDKLPPKPPDGENESVLKESQ